MSYLPCKNPSCKSFGKPHPNCRCYGEMAKGGEVGFCSSSRPHERGCQYFSDGGEAVPDDDLPTEASAAVPADDLPSEAPVPDEDLPADAEAATDEVPNEDLPPDELQAKMVAAAHPEGVTPEQEPLQQLATVGEGLAQGALPGVATLAETKLFGVDPKGIVARQEANPGEHIASETIGNVLGPGKAVQALKVGSSFVKGAILNGMVQAGDEVSRWALGQGDPHDGAGAAIVRTGLASILGGVFGKTSEATQGKVRDLAEKKIGDRILFFLHGIADAGKDTAIPESLPSGMKAGYKLGKDVYQKISSGLLPVTLTSGGEAIYGFKKDGISGAIQGAKDGAINGMIAGLAGKGAARVIKVAAPVILRVAASQTLTGVMGALNHAADMAAGSRMVNGTIDNLIKGGGLSLQHGIDKYGDQKRRDRLKGAVEDSTLLDDMQNEASKAHFAKGGVVESPQREEHQDGRATHYPEQNMLMSAARTRTLGYLNSLRPGAHSPKLAFDAEPDQREQEKSYHKALDLAGHPLGILEEVRRGTITPEHVAHFQAMHPEVNGLVQKRLTERLTKAQMDGEKPSFTVRQGLSLLMGAPLSGEFTPQMISAAQSVFAPKTQPQTPPEKSPHKGNADMLTKSDQSYLTEDQARVKRAQKV